MRISDWSSDVCSSDLYGISGARVEMVQVIDAVAQADGFRAALAAMERSPSTQIALNFDGAPVYGEADYGHFSPAAAYDAARDQIGRASCRERVCQYV